MRILRALAIGVAIPFLLASASPSPGHDQLSEILQFRDDWLRHLHERDLQGVVEGFARGAVVMPGYVAPRLGRDAIRSWYRSNFEKNRAHFDYTSHDIEIEGDWAFERWTVTVTLSPMDDGDDLLVGHTDPGQFTDTGVRVYRRLPDGDWRIDREAWDGNHEAVGYLSAVLSLGLPVAHLHAERPVARRLQRRRHLRAEGESALGQPPPRSLHGPPADLRERGVLGAHLGPEDRP